MASLIPLGASLGSSLIGGLFNSGVNSAEKNVLNANANSIKQGQGLASSLIPQGNNLIGMGAAGLSAPMNYYSSILSNNRGGIASALAPEISRIGQGYNTASQASASLNPRSGPGASFLADLPFQQQRDVSTLLQQARPAAAQGLGQLGSAALSGGSNVLGQATNALYGSTAAGNSILQQQQNLRQFNAQRGQQIGGGLFSMFQQYGLPALTKSFPGLFGGSGDGGFSSPARAIGPLDSWDG